MTAAEEWTFNTLKIHLSGEIKALKDLLDERHSGHTAQETLRAEAIKTALASILAHLAQMNEFRLALTSQQENLVTKDQLKSEIKSLEQQLTQLLTLVTSLASNVQNDDDNISKQAKARASAWALAFGIGGVAIGVFSVAQGFMR